MNKSTFLQLFAASALAITSSALWAHSPADNGSGGLKALVTQSDGIVYGKVIDIAYRNSEPTEDSPKGVPHTYVTYELARVMRGRIEGKTLTLRIPGGADGAGGVYNISSAPQFAKGQTDVLFIGGSDEDGCPLVECVEGRFRVETQQVYNGWGVPLVAAEKEMVFGGKPRFDLNVMDVPRPDFDALLQRSEVVEYLKEKNISTKEQLEMLKAEYERDTPAVYQIKLTVEGETVNEDDTNNEQALPMQQYSDPMNVDQFIALIEELNSQARPPEHAVLSADPKVAFKVTDPRLETIVTLDNGKTGMSEEEKLDREQSSSAPDSFNRTIIN